MPERLQVAEHCELSCCQQSPAASVFSAAMCLVHAAASLSLLRHQTTLSNLPTSFPATVHNAFMDISSCTVVHQLFENDCNTKPSNLENDSWTWEKMIIATQLQKVDLQNTTFTDKTQKAFKLKQWQNKTYWTLKEWIYTHFISTKCIVQTQNMTFMCRAKFVTNLCVNLLNSLSCKIFYQWQQWLNKAMSEWVSV